VGMKSNIIAFTGISLLVLFALAFISVFEIRLASAQVDASSSLPLTTDTTTLPEVLEAATSTVSTDNDASSTAASTPTSETSIAATAATSTAPVSAVQQPPQGLAEVHIIGTKYIDYFTDGTTVTSYPGNPEIDAHFAEADAPIPTHEGMTWVHTVGQPLYDTPSGDLEVGDYAVQSDGSYIENASFVSSTSTPAVSSPTDSTTGAPAVLGASTSTAPAGSDTFTPPGTWTATNTDSMVSPPPDAPESSSAASTAPATTTGI
jgi:hypothetical protein